jgi:hypothetical protein
MNAQTQQALNAAAIHHATERALEAAHDAVFAAESRAFAMALRTPDHVAVACPVAPWDCAACQAEETLSLSRESADAADRLELRAALRLAVCEGRCGIPVQRGPVPCADHADCVGEALERVGAQLVACVGGAA